MTQVVRSSVPSLAIYSGQAVDVDIPSLSDIVRPNDRLDVISVQWYEGAESKQRRAAELEIAAHPTGTGATVTVRRVTAPLAQGPLYLDLFCDIVFRLPNGSEQSEPQYHACRLAVFPEETYRVDLVGERAGEARPT